VGTREGPLVRLQRVRVFIDFWNFQLSANDVLGRSLRPDWTTLSRWLGVEAAAMISGVAASPPRQAHQRHGT